MLKKPLTKKPVVPGEADYVSGDVFSKPVGRSSDDEPDAEDYASPDDHLHAAYGILKSGRSGIGGGADALSVARGAVEYARFHNAGKILKLKKGADSDKALMAAVLDAGRKREALYGRYKAADKPYRTSSDDVNAFIAKAKQRKGLKVSEGLADRLITSVLYEAVKPFSEIAAATRSRINNGSNVTAVGHLYNIPSGKLHDVSGDGGPGDHMGHIYAAEHGEELGIKKSHQKVLQRLWALEHSHAEARASGNLELAAKRGDAEEAHFRSPAYEKAEASIYDNNIKVVTNKLSTNSLYTNIVAGGFDDKHLKLAQHAYVQAGLAHPGHRSTYVNFEAHGVDNIDTSAQNFLTAKSIHHLKNLSSFTESVSNFRKAPRIGTLADSPSGPVRVNGWVKENPYYRAPDDDLDDFDITDFSKIASSVSKYVYTKQNDATHVLTTKGVHHLSKIKVTGVPPWPKEHLDGLHKSAMLKVGIPVSR